MKFPGYASHDNGNSGCRGQDSDGGYHLGAPAIISPKPKWAAFGAGVQCESKVPPGLNQQESLSTESSVFFKLSEHFVPTVGLRNCSTSTSGMVKLGGISRMDPECS